MSSVQSEYKVVLRWKRKCSFSQGAEAKVAKEEEVSCLGRNTGKEDETEDETKDGKTFPFTHTHAAV